MSSRTSTKKYRFGLAVMRAQPLHIGHEWLINTMQTQCQDCAVVLGSVQESQTAANPLDFATRRQLIHNIFPGLKVFGAADIGNPPKWADYIFGIIKPYHVDAYYAGSEFDVSCFTGKVEHIINLDRASSEFPLVSGTMLRALLAAKNDEWEQYVNPKNIPLIKENLYGKTFE